MRWVLILLGCAIPSIQAEELKAGAAKVDITPPIGYPMWGYAARKDAPSVGVIQPLMARCLVLQVGSAKMALVGLDLGRAPTRDSMAIIRKQLQKIGINEVFLVASHTHHGPVIEIDTWPSKEKSYVRQLEQNLVDGILEANKNCQSAKIGVHSQQVPLNRNRHSKRKEKPVDSELLILRLEDKAGKPIAHAVNFAAHPTMFDSKINEFFPDYVGSLCAAVEKATGVPCLFLQGAAGDLSVHAPEGKQTAEGFGQLFGETVLQAISQIRCEIVERPTLKMDREDFIFRNQIDLNNRITKFAMERAFFPELIAAFEREYQQGIRPQLTAAVLNDSIGFVGVSGEFFCGHSLSLKRRARLEHLFFLGYCNDYHQYFPTIEATSEKGYGAVPPMSPVEVGAGEKMMDRALIKLYELRGQIQELKSNK